MRKRGQPATSITGCLKQPEIQTDLCGRIRKDTRSDNSLDNKYSDFEGD